MPSEQAFSCQRLSAVIHSIKHHVDQPFYIMILNEQTVILNSETAGYTATYRIRVEYHTLYFR